MDVASRADNRLSTVRLPQTPGRPKRAGHIEWDMTPRCRSAAVRQPVPEEHPQPLRQLLA